MRQRQQTRQDATYRSRKSVQTNGASSLCCVDFRLAVGKPHDDFCGLLSIGVYPQIKVGNDLVENFEEKRNRLRLEGSVVIQHAP
jgi:hypothetical protein